MFNVLLFSGISDLAWERLKPSPTFKKVSPGIASGFCAALFFSVFTDLCAETQSIASLRASPESSVRTKKKNDPIKVVVILLATTATGALCALHRESLFKFAVHTVLQASKRFNLKS